MKRVCAWCQKELGETKSLPETKSEPISHGICKDCVRSVLSSDSEPLRRYLDRFPGPVFLINAQRKIVTANREALSILHKKPEEVEGQLGGDAFECRYAKLPEGCGHTVHCKTCTIRRTVADTLRSGRSHMGVVAYPDLYRVTGEKKIRFIISTEKVGKAALLRIDEISQGK